MRKLFFSILFTFSAIFSFAQINNDNYEIINSIYTDFNGVSHDVYLIETNFCVVQIEISEITDEQLQDTETIIKILNRVDALYNYYKTNLPNEPEGGNENYSFKANVFFGPPSCGSGCGLIGEKGIEVSGFQNIFFNLKNDLNVNRDVIIAYEFGRNFSNNGLNKLEFPVEPNSDDKNGGFYEGFAGFMTTNAFDLIMTDPSQRFLNETLMNLKWDLKLFRAYINDLEANPYNCWASWDLIGARDSSRGKSLSGLGAYSFSLFSALHQIFDYDIYSFFENLQELNNPSSVEEALSNFAVAFSQTTNKNLKLFFENVLKFTLTEDAIQIITSLDSADDELIHDEDILWFISPDASIPLNIRSLNYLGNNNTTYKVTIDDVFYSESIEGNNQLSYSVLKNQDSVNVEVEMLIDDSVIDSYSIILKKRHNLNLISDFESELHSHYLNNPFHSTQITNDVLKIESLIENIDEVGAVNLDFMINADRIYEFSVEVRSSSQEYDGTNQAQGRPTSGWAHLLFVSYMGSEGSEYVGFDNIDGTSIIYDDDIFYDSSFTIFSNDKMPPDGDPLSAAPNYSKQISFQSIGFGTISEFKNVIFRDITDTDSDSVIDFEDNCPFTSNPDQLDSDNDGIGDVCNQTASINEFEQIQMIVFPNPSHSNWTVRTPNNLIETVDLFTLFGTKVLSLKPNNNSVEISNKRLSSGIYFAKVKTDAGSKTLKLIRQ